MDFFHFNFLRVTKEKCIQCNYEKSNIFVLDKCESTVDTINILYILYIYIYNIY